MRIIYSFLLIILFVILSASLYSQELRGKVIAENGRTASSVTVMFKNKAKAVVTDASGKFIIIAKKLPDTLLFSGVGLEPYMLVVTEETLKDTNFEIVLLNNRSALSEVVVTGYYSSKKKDVTGSVSTLKLDDTKSADTESGFYKRGLKGKAPDSEISGAPGSASEIRIRGTSSFGEIATLNNKKIGLYDTTIFVKAAPYANILTAGEVNDFYKWKMWEDFTETEFKQWSDHWKINPKKRITVQLVNENHAPAINEKVELKDEAAGEIAWTAFTDNTGKAELWGDIDSKNKDTKFTIVTDGGKDVSKPGFFENGINTIQLKKSCTVSDKVDIAFVVDATGSMSDEIEFLKLELEDVIRKTFEKNKNLNLRAGSVFYRDRNDEYLTKKIDFNSDLLKLLNFVKLQSAGGGGDYPEAIESALSMAIDSLQWRNDARSRILFLIMDAPPHDNAKEEILELTVKAAAKGIRIITVACSGTNKPTEYLMRSIALATNGTYLFLTNNSGVGLPHIKPTTDNFSVELLNTLLQRVINQMIAVSACTEAKKEQPVFIKTENTENVKIYPNPTSGNFILETDKPLKEIYIADFNGKILQRLSVSEKDRKWNVSIGTYANSTYLVKYITSDNRWGAEKVVLIH